MKKINYTLAILTERKIDNGNSIKYKNNYYQPYLNGKLKCFMSKTECLVIEAYNGDLLVSIDEQILELKELQKHERFSKDFDKTIEIKEKKKYIPPMSHPWKLASFKKQCKKHTLIMCMPKENFMPRKLLTNKFCKFQFWPLNLFCIIFLMNKVNMATK